MTSSEAEYKLEITKGKLAECEARLSKAVDALRFLEIAATGSGVPHPQERKLLHETIYKARAVLTELEKANDPRSPMPCF